VVDVSDARHTGGYELGVADEARGALDGAVGPVVAGRLGGEDDLGAAGLEERDGVLDVVGPGVDDDRVAAGGLGEEGWDQVS